VLISRNNSIMQGIFCLLDTTRKKGTTRDQQDERMALIVAARNLLVSREDPEVVMKDTNLITQD